jgi:hypothetical protein
MRAFPRLLVCNVRQTCNPPFWVSSWDYTVTQLNPMSSDKIISRQPIARAPAQARHAQAIGRLVISLYYLGDFDARLWVDVFRDPRVT